jgi:hypothetical protein
MPRESRSHYQVYLLRLWRERPASAGNPAAWRFVLENPNTRQKHGFDKLEGLLAFLQACVSVEAAPE